MNRTILLLMGLGAGSLVQAGEPPVQICLGEGDEWTPLPIGIARMAYPIPAA
jgi:polar amino acid transport system substrate-binding protein